MARVDLCDLHVFGPILVCLALVINLVLNLVPVLVPVYMAKYQNTKIPRHLLRVSTVIRPRDVVLISAIRAGQFSRPNSGRLDEQ